MKKLLFLLATVGMIFTACEGGGFEEENGGTPSTPKIELSQQSVEVEFEPAKYEVAVTSPYSWEATTKNDWIVVNVGSGIAGTKVLKFTVERNEEEEIREGTILLTNSTYNLAAELYVTQKAFTPIIEYTKSLTFAVDGGTQEVAITANFEYKYSTNADWLTIEKSEKGVNISATPNTKFEERTAETTISSEKYGISKTIAVTQKGVSAESQNVILYTSSDGEIVTPYATDVFGANIVSNTYVNGQGVIIFDAPVTLIGEMAFYDCTSLTSVTIPNSVTEIGEGAFAYCYSLTSVTIGNSITSIGDCAFYKCSSLTSVTIPDSVTSIGNYAFRECTSLTSVTIGNGVTSIGEYAFEGCSSLTSVTIPDSATSIGDYAFYYCSSLKAFYGKFASADNRCLIVDGVLNSFASAGLTEYTIPDSVTSIGSSAFDGCSSLASITIPDSVTSIGRYAFRGCTLLTSITIPDNVTSIGKYAFNNCSSLTSVTIPDSVTEIGGSAFEGCTSLISVYCKPTTPPTASSYYFGYWRAFDDNASGRKICVSRNSVSAYMSASGWSEYASNIVGYDF